MTDDQKGTRRPRRLKIRSLACSERTERRRLRC